MDPGPGASTIPADAVFVCAYEQDVFLTTFEESAYIRRASGTDELWITSQYQTKLAVSDPTADDLPVAARRLLDQYYRSLWAIQGPKKILTPGLLCAEDLNALLTTIQADHDRNVAAAKSIDSRLVEVARELGLCPEPTGTGGTHWQARCPGTNHPLYIEAAVESFGCGWCRRKGGEAELRDFVRERRERYPGK
jgi:hypothetical protein